MWISFRLHIPGCLCESYKRDVGKEMFARWRTLPSAHKNTLHVPSYCIGGRLIVCGAAQPLGLRPDGAPNLFRCKPFLKTGCTCRVLPIFPTLCAAIFMWCPYLITCISKRGWRAGTLYSSDGSNMRNEACWRKERKQTFPRILCLHTE